MSVLGTASDEVLHLHLAAGDGPEQAAAWDEVVRRHGAELIRYFWCASVRVKLPDAEDLLQDTLTGAVADIASYDPAEGPLRAWIFGIAKHRLLDWLKGRSRKKRAGSVPLPDDPGTIDVAPATNQIDARLDYAAVRNRMREFSADLDDVDRDLVETFLRAGEIGPDDQRRIAACHARPLGTIRVRKTRLLAALRELLKDFAPFGRYGGAR